MIIGIIIAVVLALLAVWVVNTRRSLAAMDENIDKKMSTVRTANFTRKDRTAMGHEIEVRYIAGIMV